MLELIVLVSAVTHPVATGAVIAGLAILDNYLSTERVDVHVHEE